MHKNPSFGTVWLHGFGMVVTVAGAAVGYAVGAGLLIVIAAELLGSDPAPYLIWAAYLAPLGIPWFVGTALRWERESRYPPA